MLQRRGDDGDPDTFNECLFRTENLVGAIRFHRGEFAVALKAFENVQKSYVDSGVYEKWKVRDAASAEFEYAYLLYFRGVTWVSVGQYEKAYQDLENALEIFKRGGYTSWADQCEMNIKQGRELEQQQAKK
jgi:tetratricopeptide (TPR) repeat protein